MQSVANVNVSQSLYVYDMTMESVLGEDKSVNRMDVCEIVNFERRQTRYVQDIQHSTSRLSD